MGYLYKRVAVGGTFDLLHKGHQYLLLTAFKNGRFVTIGVTSDKMNKSAGNPTYQNQNQRRRNVREFLKSHNLQKRAKITSINDLYGPTITHETIDALITSEQRLAGANLINRKRTAIGLSKLPLIVAKIVRAEDKKPISSSRITKGAIDQEGKNYLMSLYRIAGGKISPKARARFKKPFGKVVKISKSLKVKDSLLIAVGDITVFNLLAVRITPDISIVDFKVARQRKFKNLMALGFNTNNPSFIAKNQPGAISKELIHVVNLALGSTNKNSVILVDGEEDLATVPTVLLSPLGTTVFYGQPQKGAVKVFIDLKTKNRLSHLLNL